MQEAFGMSNLSEETAYKPSFPIADGISQNESNEDYAMSKKPAFSFIKETQDGFKPDGEIESQYKEEVKSLPEKSLPIDPAPQNLLEDSHNILDQLKSFLELNPAQTKSLISEESSKYDRVVIELQVEQQSFLVEKEKLEQERHNRIKEKESLGKLLADLIREEKYVEADILQQKLSAVTENVNRTEKKLEIIFAKLNSNERSKTECYKDKEKLLGSVSEILNDWTVICLKMLEREEGCVGEVLGCGDCEDRDRG
eukprot:TRINITY_DN8926_c0_g1_i10.p1 TRINITY_DN8926_c0_g1~~TRINITY_DN8926_c0_g1_i10.p1  ORF type:complete len:255 (-),score=55.16 TRINITY_DN8926_c0_g1_i10:125-889(-)